MPPKLSAVRVALVLLVLLSGGCGERDVPPIAIPLIDSYKPELVTGSVPPANLPERTEWRFDGPVPAPAEFAATRGWEAGPGVADLRIENGRLAGRTTTDFPLIRLALPGWAAKRDFLHSVEVRMRVSAGSNLALSFRPQKDELAQFVIAARGLPWRFTAPLTAGGELRTYVLTSPMSLSASGLQYFLIRPTDVPGAAFEIESVRVVFHEEHLATLPSGARWEGLSEIYRETLVARSPERIRMEVTLPQDPWLDLAVGTGDDRPVTFRVAVGRPGEDEDTVLLERTVTRPDRWEPAPVDLSKHAGQRVTLSLSLAAERPGTLGFWGSPVVRSRGGRPAGRDGSPPPPQGVILIWADTLRRDHLDVYGYGRPTAPFLRRMAADGALFQDCQVTAPWTKISTPSVLTSLYASTHGVVEFSHHLPASAETLAEVFRGAGHATLSLSSILYTGKLSGLHQGFEELHESGSLPNQGSSKTTREYMDRLLPWLESHRDVPFFVFLHIADPHDPYRPDPPYDSKWADPAGRAEHERQMAEMQARIGDHVRRVSVMPSREELAAAGFDPEAYVQYDRDWYDGSILGMDVEIGRLFERLRSLGLDEKTLVVFTSDHGEEFLDHERTFHGHTVYKELADAPLIARWPGGIPAGTVVPETVSTIDVMPTILEMSHLPVPAAAQGQSLVPLLAGERSRPWRQRPVICEKLRTEEAAGAPPPQDTESLAFMAGDWKLIHNLERHAGTPEFELYHRRQDPRERQNLAQRNPEVVKRLAGELAAWRRKALAARPKPDAETAKSLRPEDVERLRSLGYLK